MQRRLRGLHRNNYGYTNDDKIFASTPTARIASAKLHKKAGRCSQYVVSR